MSSFTLAVLFLASWSGLVMGATALAILTNMPARARFAYETVCVFAAHHLFRIVRWLSRQAHVSVRLESD
jgi:hypothetical protein